MVAVDVSCLISRTCRVNLERHSEKQLNMGWNQLMEKLDQPTRDYWTKVCPYMLFAV